MAKGDDKKNYQDAQAQAKTQTGQLYGNYNQFSNDIAARIPADRAAADKERSYLTEQYQGRVNGGADRDYLRSITGGPPFTEGNYPGSDQSGDGGSGGGGGTGSPSDPYGSVRGGFGDFANSGGVNYGAMTEALGGFRNLSNTGGFTDENRQSLANISRGYGDIASKPFDRTDIDSSLSTLRDASRTGGYDPSKLGLINSDIDKLRNFQSITPERLAELRSQQNRLTNLDGSNVQTDINALRALDPQFADWARTGGYTDADQSNFRARAGSTVPAFYSGVKDEIARRNALSGGYSPGYSSSIRAISRDSARGAADATRNAEVDLQNNIRAGRQYGLSGQATNRVASGTLANSLLGEQRQGLEQGTRLGQDLDLALAGNSLRGIEGATEAQSRLEADQANNRITGATNAGNLALNTGREESAAKLSALTGQRQTELDPISIANEARLRALTGITDTSQGAERTVQSGRQFGLQGLFGIAQSEEASRQAAAARASAAASAQQGYDLQRAQLASQNERFSQEMGLNSLGGLSDLYRSAPGQVGMYNDDYLNSLSGNNQAIVGGVGSQQPYNSGNGGSWWQSGLTSGIGALAKIWGGGGGKGPAMNSYQGYTDDMGRPLNGSQDSYFGSPWTGGGTPPYSGDGSVDTNETYDLPNNPDSPNNNMPGIRYTGSAYDPRFRY